MGESRYRKNGDRTKINACKAKNLRSVKKFMARNGCKVSFSIHPLGGALY